MTHNSSDQEQIITNEEWESLSLNSKTKLNSFAKTFKKMQESLRIADMRIELLLGFCGFDETVSNDQIREFIQLDWVKNK